MLQCFVALHKGVWGGPTKLTIMGVFWGEATGRGRVWGCGPTETRQVRDFGATGRRQWHDGLTTATRQVRDAGTTAARLPYEGIGIVREHASDSRSEQIMDIPTCIQQSAGRTGLRWMAVNDPIADIESVSRVPLWMGEQTNG